MDKDVFARIFSEPWVLANLKDVERVANKDYAALVKNVKQKKPCFFSGHGAIRCSRVPPCTRLAIGDTAGEESLFCSIFITMMLLHFLHLLQLFFGKYFCTLFFGFCFQAH